MNDVAPVLGTAGVIIVWDSNRKLWSNGEKENNGSSTGGAVVGAFVLDTSGSSPSPNKDMSYICVKVSVSRLITGGGKSLRASSGGDRTQ